MAAPTLTIDVNDVWDDLVAGSLRITQGIQKRSSASFTLKRAVSALSVGLRVELAVSGTALFSGFVERIAVRELVSNATTTEISVDCTDLHQVCDRRLVSNTWASDDAGGIFDDVVDDVLDLEGITFTDTGTGIHAETVDLIEADYVTARTVLDAVVAEVGGMWWIDADGELHLEERYDTAASWNAGSTSAVRDTRRDRFRADFCNRIYYRYLKETDMPTSPTSYPLPAFNGNELRSWVVPYNIDSIVSCHARSVLPSEDRWIKEASDDSDIAVASTVNGAGFTQSVTGAVSAQSNDGGCSGDILIYGRRTGTTAAYKETLSLSGTTRATSANSWDVVYAIDASDSGLAGTITVYADDTGTTTMVAVDSGDTEGMLASTGETGKFHTIPYIVHTAGTYSGDEAGIVGVGTDNAAKLGYAEVESAADAEADFDGYFRTVTHILTGGIASGHTCAVYAPYELLFTQGTPNIFLANEAETPDGSSTFQRGYQVRINTQLETTSYVDATSSLVTEATTYYPALLATLEGGTSSGQYEDFLNLVANGTLTSAEALALATIELKKRCAFIDRVSYVTRETGLSVGEVQTLSFGAIGATTDYMITQIEIRDDPKDSESLMYAISLERSAEVADRMKLWRTLINK